MHRYYLCRYRTEISLITTLSVSGKIKRWTIEQIAFDADRDIEDEIIEDGDDD